MNSKLINIFAIKRYAIHDGPDIRVTVFFKGCPLRCLWCHNPEGIGFTNQILHLPEKCVACNECISRCPNEALHNMKDHLQRDQNKCSLCGTCVDICPALAHESTGRMMAVETIMAEIQKELPFFERSGGGVTCSGGEPLSQPEGLLSLLMACGQLGIHRTVDTSGLAPLDTLMTVAEHTELFLYDVKHINNETHKKLTGVANELILTNLKTLAKHHNAIRVRIPLIAGVNDDDANIQATGMLVTGYNSIQGIDLLPYHANAKAKYRKLGQRYEGDALAAPSKAVIEHIAEILRNYVPDVSIGG